MWIGTRSAKIAVFCLCLAPAAWLATTALTDGLGADPIRYITLETGVWTLRLLMITLCITPVRKLTGWNHLIRHRRMLGLAAFFYGTLHFMTYMGLDQFFSAASIAVDIYKRPFVTAGFTGFAVMVPLAITSTKKWIARLGGRRWQFLHRLIYAAAIAGIVHYLWLVKSDIRDPLAYAFGLAALLGWRVFAAWKGRPSLNAGRVAEEARPANS